MGYDSINRQILRLSLPAIVSNVTVPLLGLFDTAISGHLGSENFLAAIAVGSVMLNVLFWLFGFLRMGTTGLTATALGANDGKGIRKIFTESIGIGVVAGLLLILFRYPLLDCLTSLIGADAAIAGSVQSYFLIRIAGAPALLATMAICGWFVGMQNTVYPLVISVAMNIINIVISYLLVYPLGMGFEGVATGTMISNYAGLAIAAGCSLYFMRGKRLFCSIRELFRGRDLSRFFSVNSNLFIRSFCIICVTLGVTAAGSRLGVMVLAINVIVMQFFQFFSFFMDGFAFSGEAMAGLYSGARDFGKLRESVRALLLWTLGMALAFSVVYGFGFSAITALLTDSETVRQSIESVFIFVLLIPSVSAWAFIYDGFYVGLTDTRLMMLSTVLATVMFYIIAFLSFDNGRLVIETGGNSSIWTAFLVYLGIRGLVLAAFWKSRVNRLRSAGQIILD